MKTNQLFISLALIGMLILSACSAAAPTDSQPAGGQPANAQSTPGAGGPGGSSQALKLAIGTLKLEGTSNAVTAEQAAELLPLWKAVRSLSKSESAANQEIQGVFKQIEQAMSSEQMTAIDAMQIDMDSMQQIASELGLELGGPTGSDPGIQATMQAARSTAQAGGESGGFPGGPGGGGPPGGGFGGMGGGPGMEEGNGVSDEARATAMAQRGGRGARVGLPDGLVEAVIKALEAHTAP